MQQPAPEQSTGSKGFTTVHPEPLEDQLVLESLLSRGNPNYKPAFPIVVIYFTASWCRACKAVNIPELMGLRSDI